MLAPSEVLCAVGYGKRSTDAVYRDFVAQVEHVVFVDPGDPHADFEYAGFESPVQVSDTARPDLPGARQRTEAGRTPG